MRSDDSTDDDARPKKTIPSWARSNYFSFLVIRKHVGITFGSYFERKPLVHVIILFYDEISFLGLFLFRCQSEGVVESTSHVEHQHEFNFPARSVAPRSEFKYYFPYQTTAFRQANLQCRLENSTGQLYVKKPAQCLNFTLLAPSSAFFLSFFTKCFEIHF